MPKKIILSEAQLKELVAKKKKDKKIAEEIQRKIDVYNSLLKESHTKISGVKTIIESYRRKGLINKNVMKILSENKSK